MPAKFDRCVESVKRQNMGKPKSKQVNPYAVCQSSMNKKKKARKRS